MKKIALILIVVLFASMVAMAQDEKVQVFGGWQFTSIDSKANPIGTSRLNTAKGWDADVAFKATKNFAIVADVSGAYKSESISISGVSATGSLHSHSFLFGPRFMANSGKVTPFGEALFGVVHTSLSGNVAGVGVGSTGVNDFGMAFGGGLDVHASKSVAVRLAKFDYMYVRDSGVSINNFRIASGIVFKF